MMVAGIVLHDGSGVTVALLDPSKGKCNSASFGVDRRFPDALDSFIKESGATSGDILICLELYQTPINTFPGFIYFLKGISNYAASNITVSQDKKKALIGDIPVFMKWAAHKQKEVRLIFPGMAKALFLFQNGRNPSTPEVARTIAVICSTIGKYRYCRSTGTVQSAADVAAFLRYPPKNGSGVVSAGDWYQMVAAPGAKIGVDRSEVFLTYEIGKKEYKYLHPVNALKMGLLHTCREYSFKLYCGSLEGEEGKIMEKLWGDKGVAALSDEYLVWGP